MGIIWHVNAQSVLLAHHCNMNCWTRCLGLLSDFIASLWACEETELRAWMSEVALCTTGVFYKHDPTSHHTSPRPFTLTTSSVIRHPAMGLECSGLSSAEGSVQAQCQQRSGWAWGEQWAHSSTSPHCIVLCCVCLMIPLKLAGVYDTLLCFISH